LHHPKVFENSASFSRQLQSKLDELHNGFETSMHAIHAFRNHEDDDDVHNADGESTPHTDVKIHDLEQQSVSSYSGGGEQLRTLQEMNALNLRGETTAELPGRSDHVGQQGEEDPLNGGCAKKPVKLKSKGWHVEADACTGAQWVSVRAGMHSLSLCGLSFLPHSIQSFVHYVLQGATCKHIPVLSTAQL
jgi:hypothetical protein